MADGPKSPWVERDQQPGELDAVVDSDSGLHAGDLESAVIYKALAYDILRGKDGNVARVFPGHRPHEIDQLELWQIAEVIGDEGRNRPAGQPPPVVPDDWEDRAKVYAEVMARRKSEKGKAR